MSFAIFLCFSLLLHGIAMPHICRPSMVGRIMSEFLCWQLAGWEILVCVYRCEICTLISPACWPATKEFLPFYQWPTICGISMTCTDREKERKIAKDTGQIISRLNEKLWLYLVHLYTVSLCSRGCASCFCSCGIGTLMNKFHPNLTHYFWIDFDLIASRNLIPYGSR